MLKVTGTLQPEPSVKTENADVTKSKNSLQPKTTYRTEDVTISTVVFPNYIENEIDSDVSDFWTRNNARYRMHVPSVPYRYRSGSQRAVAKFMYTELWAARWECA